MAGQTPHDPPFEPLQTDGASAPAHPITPRDLQSVWQTEWQWVALAWSGGLFVGGILLMLAFASQSDAQKIAAMIGGGLFLAIVPGLCATLQTWQGHRRSIGKGSIWPWGKRY